MKGIRSPVGSDAFVQASSAASQETMERFAMIKTVDGAFWMRIGEHVCANFVTYG